MWSTHSCKTPRPRWPPNSCRSHESCSHQAPNHPTAGSAITPTTTPPKAAAMAPAANSTAAPLPSLSFKEATLLDEKREPDARKRRARASAGRRGRTGAQTVRDSAVRLTGPQALLVQFPATTLAAGPLHTRGSGSLEFIATMPQRAGSSAGGLQVALVTGSGQ